MLNKTYLHETETSDGLQIHSLPVGGAYETAVTRR